MWPFKRRFAFEVNSKVAYITKYLGVDVLEDNSETGGVSFRGRVYQDDKIRIRQWSGSTDVWVKMPGGESQIEHVFDRCCLIGSRLNVYRYGHWVEYLWTLSARANEAKKEVEGKEAARQRHNFSDIDDSIVFKKEIS